MSDDTHAPPVDRIAELIQNGFPPLPETRESRMRATAVTVAEALVKSYRTETPSTDDQVPRLTRLFGLHPDLHGMVFAVEHLTELRLKQLRHDADATDEVGLSPELIAADASPAQREHFTLTQNVVTDIWTGAARHIPLRRQRGITTFRAQTSEQICDVVLLMARQIALLGTDAS